MREREHITGAGIPKEGRAAKVAADVARDGWSLIGALDGNLTRRLRRAVDEVAARSSHSSSGGQLHLLSGLSRHPDLAEVVDWPPLLAVVLELLSPNVYINHSHLDVHPPHPPTGARQWHRDNGLMGRDMRLPWRDQPRVTLKVAVYLTDVQAPDDGALEVLPGSHLDAKARHPAEQQPCGVPILGPAGTVAVFDARIWHRRRDNLGIRTRRAISWRTATGGLPRATCRSRTCQHGPGWRLDAASCSATRQPTPSTGHQASSRWTPDPPPPAHQACDARPGPNRLG